MAESTNDIFRRNYCKTPEWIADFFPHIVFTKPSGYQFSFYKFSLKAVSSRVINPLLTKLARDRTDRISALGTVKTSGRYSPSTALALGRYLQHAIIRLSKAYSFEIFLPENAFLYIFTMLHKLLHFVQGSSVLRVEILDINDNPPEFVPSPSASLSTYIRLTDEGPDSVNRVIIDVNATDKDDGTNAKIVYSLSGDQHGYFQLDSSTVGLRVFLIYK